MDKKTVKTIIKVIVILGYIGCAISILIGLGLIAGGMLGGGFIANMMKDSLPVAGLGAMIGGVLAVVGIISIIFGIVGIFINKALGEYKNWARWVVLVLAGIGVLGSLPTFPASILTLIIDGFLIYFFGFVPEVKKLYEGK